MKQITEAQEAELRKFASKHGRSWKKELQHQWMKATAPQELLALRNSHGPRWLATFKL